MTDHIPAAGPYKDFASNPVIAELATKKRWTVSAVNKHKMPVDFKNLMTNKTVFGAKFSDERCLVDLDTVETTLPNATNNAFYLDARMDKYLILDIESNCPPEQAEEMLDKLPAYYAEVSLSGQGYHLVMPLPRNWDEFPLAQTKPAIKAEDKTHEILVDHWVTFTRRQVTTLRDPQDPYALRAWDELYADLASKVTVASSTGIDISDEKPEIPCEDIIMRQLMRVELKKTVADFNNDHSSFEFSVMGRLYSRLKRTYSILSNTYDGLNETVEAQSWLLYQAAQEHLPHRDKHDEERDGLPYLLYTAVNLINRDNAQAKDSSD